MVKHSSTVSVFLLIFLKLETKDWGFGFSLGRNHRKHQLVVSTMENQVEIIIRSRNGKHF